MNLSINGQSQVPPGFRFHPTEEELLHYYLRKKVCYEKIDLDVICDVDLNKLEPWDIQEKCKIGSTPQNDWYFFSHKDKKYPTGTRTNRATAAGFWKATGRDKIIYSGCTRIGLRKTLVFYKGRAPHGQKSDWIMHEYRLDDNNDTTVLVGVDASAQEEGWVVCRVFKKKNYQKAVENPRVASTSASMETKLSYMNTSGVLDQILVYMGRSCKMENSHHHHHHEPSISTINNLMGLGSDGQERFVRLPRLESPTLSSHLPMITASPAPPPDQHAMTSHDDQRPCPEVNDWAALDRLVASQLNGQDGDASYTPRVDVTSRHEASETSSQVAYNSYSAMSESDFWGFTKSLASTSPLDPLCHLSV